MKPAVFIDRDGTVSHEVGYVNHVSRFRLYPWTVDAIRHVNRAGWLAVSYSGDRLIRRIKGSARLRGAADRTEAVVGAMVGALIARSGSLGRIVEADFRSAKGIGGRDGSGPARCDRRKDLHRQRDQKNRKKS